MSQHDFSIDNQSAPAFRSDLNDALQALAGLSSGPSAPSTTYANMLWYDTANNILKMRTEADDGWISVAYIDQGAGAFRVLDDTQVVNTSGTQTGLIGDQAEATWEAGTGTTESLVSPAKIKAAIEALAPSTIIAAGNFDGSGTPAWNYRNGFGATITDNGAGDYTVAFDAAEADANYVVSVTGESVGAGINNRFFVFPYSLTTAGFSVRVVNINGVATDLDGIHLVVHRLSWT